MLEGFKKFVFRGNAIDLAVGVVIGAAFGKVVEAIVGGLLTPFIGAIAKLPDFSTWAITINGSKFAIGNVINSLVSFILIAAAVYFFVILPMNKLMERFKRDEKPKDPTDKKCIECYSVINIQARRCPFCTTQLGDLQP